MKKLFITAIICLAAVPRTASALQEYYSLSRSIRGLGMGGAYYGLSNDEYALFYNPANLAFYEGGAQGMLSFNAQLSPSVLSAVNTLMESSGKSVDAIAKDLGQYQGQNLAANAAFFPYYLRKHFAVGLLVADTKANFSLLGRDLDTALDLTAISDSGFFVGYGTSVWDNLYVGVTLKGVFRIGGRKEFTVLDIAQQQAAELDFKELGGGGAGVDVDLGVTYELPVRPFGSRHRVSLVFNNLLASQFTIARIEGPPPALVRTVTLAGHSRLPGVGPFRHFDVVLDFAEFGLGGESNENLGARGGSFFKHVNLGVEAPLGWFFLRTGFRQGYWTAGLGVDARFLKLDLATYQEELFSRPGLFPSRRFALRLVFGISAAAPAVEPQTESKPVREEKAPPAVEPNEKSQPETQKNETEGKTEEKPKPATSGQTQQRTPSSVARRKGRRVQITGDENDRFDVDSLVEEYPNSYNYPQD